MSQENVEIVRRRYEHLAATGDYAAEAHAPDFVWDMSKFRGWPEQQTYEGVEGARAFLRDWLEAWDDWEVEVEALHDAGDKVVALVRQRGRSKTSGLPVDMAYGQVFTIRDGKFARMEMYADPAEAMAAVGLGAMSQENVSLTRRVYDALSRRDIDGFLDIFDEDVEMVISRLAPIEGAGYKGHEGIRRWWEDVLDVWPDLTAEILEVHALGDELTYGAVRFHAHGAGSDVPVDWTLWQIGRWRGGKLVWLQSADTRAAALEAAGLSEQDAHADA